MSTKIFKMYGMQRTKTNYFQKLLGLNFSDIIVLSNLSGWKHGLVQTNVDWSGDNWEETLEISKQYYMSNMSEAKGQSKMIDKAFKNKSVGFIFSYRNPYTNYMSREKHYNDKDKFIKDFVSNWNMKNNNYMSFYNENDNCFMFKFEDLVGSKKIDTLDSFAKKFDLKRSNNSYVDVENRVDPRMQNTNVKFVEPPSVKQMEIPEYIKEYFYSHIDHKLMLNLGYEVLT